MTLAPDGSLLGALSSLFWFSFKVFLIICVYLWLRATLPRLRYDRLMAFTWKGMLPIALVNILLVAAVLTFFYPERRQTSQAPPAPAATRAASAR